jgi:glutathione peroxidase
LPNASGDTQRWNFHEYLLDRQVRVVASFRAEVSPQDERPIMAIEVLL